MKKFTKVIVAASALLMITSMVFIGCGKPKSKVEIGIVLPTKDEPRWIQDETQFKKVLEGQAGVELLFSQGDSGKEKQNVETLLTKGIKVLIICPQDGTAAAAAAAVVHVPVVKPHLSFFPFLITNSFIWSP